MRRAILSLAGAALLTCFVWARPAAVWQPVDTLRTGNLSAVADFNRDGSPDRVRSDRSVVNIALSEQRSSTVQLTHNTPVVGLLALDVDRDGDVDVLTLTRAGRLRIWRNNGHGRFSAELIVPRRLFDRHLPPVLQQADSGDCDQPIDGPGYRHLLSAPPGSAAMPAPTRAGVGYRGPATSVRGTWSSRPSSPRAPPTRLAA